MSFNILPKHLFYVVNKCREPKTQRVARHKEYFTIITNILYGKFLKRYNSLLRAWDHNKDMDVFLDLVSSFCETSSTNLSPGY